MGRSGSRGVGARAEAPAGRATTMGKVPGVHAPQAGIRSVHGGGQEHRALRHAGLAQWRSSECPAAQLLSQPFCSPLQILSCHSSRTPHPSALRLSAAGVSVPRGSAASAGRAPRENTREHTAVCGEGEPVLRRGRGAVTPARGYPTPLNPRPALSAHRYKAHPPVHSPLLARGQPAILRASAPAARGRPFLCPSPASRRWGARRDPASGHPAR